jgi:hypothetical protein
MGHLGHFLLVIGNADHGERPLPAGSGKRPIVKAAAIPQSIARTVESQQRGEHDLWLHLSRSGLWLADAPHPLDHWIAGLPCAENKRLPFTLHRGERELKARGAQSQQKRERIDLLSDCRQAGYDDARGQIGSEETESVCSQSLSRQGAVPFEALFAPLFGGAAQVLLSLKNAGAITQFERSC